MIWLVWWPDQFWELKVNMDSLEGRMELQRLSSVDTLC